MLVEIVIILKQKSRNHSMSRKINDGKQQMIDFYFKYILAKNSLFNFKISNKK